MRHLAAQFPGVNVIQGDAFDLDATLGDKRGMMFDSRRLRRAAAQLPGVARIAYIEDLLGRIPPGRPIMQLTYGPLSPVPPGRGNYKVEHYDFVLRNIPPTQLWVYRRPPRIDGCCSSTDTGCRGLICTAVRRIARGGNRNGRG